jgi:carbon monoxide dehydrogenase subunit G
MSTFETTIDIEAPIEKVWEALADIGSISKWNPGVHESHGTSDETTGLGATRFCDLGGKNYLNEQVVDFETCHKLTMRITDTNMPFEKADIHFTLEADGDNTRVTCAPAYTLKYGPMGALMDRFYVRGTYEKGMQRLLRGLKEHVESQPLTSAQPAETLTDPLPA